MPTYEYRCPQGHEFEEFQSIAAEPVARCPRCNRRSRRLVSAGAGLIFKGAGFYATDYKRNGSDKGSPGNQHPPPPESEKDTTTSTSNKQEARATLPAVPD